MTAIVDPKRLATLKARAALAGVIVHVLDNSLHSLDALEAWLDRVTGKTVKAPAA